MCYTGDDERRRYTLYWKHTCLVRYVFRKCRATASLMAMSSGAMKYWRETEIFIILPLVASTVLSPLHTVHYNCNILRCIPVTGCMPKFCQDGGKSPFLKESDFKYSSSQVKNQNKYIVHDNSTASQNKNIKCRDDLDFCFDLNQDKSQD